MRILSNEQHFTSDPHDVLASCVRAIPACCLSCCVPAHTQSIEGPVEVAHWAACCSQRGVASLQLCTMLLVSESDVVILAKPRWIATGARLQAAVHILQGTEKMKRDSNRKLLPRHAWRFSVRWHPVCLRGKGVYTRRETRFECGDVRNDGRACTRVCAAHRGSRESG
jgi:hypothetical protein